MTHWRATVTGIIIWLLVSPAWAQDDARASRALPSIGSVGGRSTSSSGRLGKPSPIVPGRDGSYTLQQVQYTRSSLPPATLPAPTRAGIRPVTANKYESNGVEVYESEGPPAGLSTFSAHPLYGAPDWFQPSWWVRGTFESDHAFDGFVSPVTNPFFFEDPRALTEVRPIFIFQHIPDRNWFFRGGDVEFFGLQARLALSERFSFVIHKLGLIAVQPDASGPGAPRDDVSFSDIQIGPKLTFWRDDVRNLIMAFGTNFEIGAGDHGAFQNTGSGAITPYISVGKELWPDFHLLGTLGHRFGFDNHRSDSLFLSLHADYGFFGRIYPFVEFTWFHYTDNGRDFNGDFEGQDVFNFGATRVTGNDVVTMAAGVRIKFTESFQGGFAFEFPLTHREDLLDYRLTFDLIFRY